MGNPHHPVNYPNGAYPVRPGSSDALTARTIDATVHPPLVRAQETVATIGPRLIDTVTPLATSPLFLSMVALTLIFAWVAVRIRLRPLALLLGAFLMMGLTSFRPLRLAPAAPKASRVDQRIADSRRPHTVVRGEDNRYFPTPPDMLVDAAPIGAEDVAPEPAPDADPPAPMDYGRSRDGYWGTPETPLPPAAPYDIQIPGGRLIIPRVPIAPIPEAEMSMKLMRSAERMARQNEHLREMMLQLRENAELQAIMEQLRDQLREEARKRRMRRVAVGY